MTVWFCLSTNLATAILLCWWY